MEELDKQPLPEMEKIVGRPSKFKGHAEELVDHYWGSINYILELVRASEVKAGLILSFYGIALNFILPNIQETLVAQDTPFYLYVLLGLWLICTVISIYFSVRCFIPRIEAKYEPNVFFFGDVITKFGTIKDFSKTFYRISLSQDELFDQLGQQIFILSKIASKKFGYVNRSLRYLAIGLLIFLMIVIYYAILGLTQND